MNEHKLSDDPMSEKVEGRTRCHVVWLEKYAEQKKAAQAAAKSAPKKSRSSKKKSEPKKDAEAKALEAEIEKARAAAWAAEHTWKQRMEKAGRGSGCAV